MMMPEEPRVEKQGKERYRETPESCEMDSHSRESLCWEDVGLAIPGRGLWGQSLTAEASV